MRSWFERAAVAALVVLTLTLAIVAAPAERETWDPRASSFLAGPRGAKALYLMLDGMGVPVDRRRMPLDGRAWLPGPLALVALTRAPMPHELDALLRWLEEGGTLIYVARPGDPTIEALGLPSLTPLAPADSAGHVVVAVSPPDAGVPARGERPTDGDAGISAALWLAGTDTARGFRWAFGEPGDEAQHGLVPLLRTADGRAVVAAARRRAGMLVAWSDAEPLRNHALRDSGGALLFARIAEHLTDDGSPLVFDEFHHGFRGEGSAVAGTLRFLQSTPAGHGTLQLLAVGLALLVAAGTRFGAPVPPPAAQRRSPLEHVEALAGLYRRAGAHETARRLLVCQLARRLYRRPPGRGDDEQIGRAHV